MQSSAASKGDRRSGCPSCLGAVLPQDALSVVVDHLDVVQRLALVLLLAKDVDLGVALRNRENGLTPTGRVLEITTGRCKVSWPTLKSRLVNMREVAYFRKSPPKRRRLWMYSAACHGLLDLVLWCHLSLGSEWDEQTCYAAAWGGQLAMLQWLRTQGCPWDAHAMDAAAEGGHLGVLLWMKQQGLDACSKVCDAAAQGGHLHLLEFLQSEGYPWMATGVAAANGGHLGVLQWCLAQGCPWATGIYPAAAEKGDMEGSGVRLGPEDMRCSGVRRPY